MKKFATMAISVALIGAMVAGGSLAYLQDTDSDVNVMTLGEVKIMQMEQERINDTDREHSLKGFKQRQTILPAVYEGSSIPWAPEAEWVEAGNQAWKVVEDNVGVIDKFVSVKNNGRSDAYVRTVFAIEVGPNGVNDDYMHIVTNGTNITEGATWDWQWVDGTVVIEDGAENHGTYAIAVATYTDKLGAKKTTIPSLKQVYLDKKADNEVVEAYDEDYRILAVSQAVQAEGFDVSANELDNAKKALDTAFESVTIDNAASLFGAEVKDMWDGTADTSWYNGTDTEFTLRTAEELAGLAELVDGGNDFAGKTIKLASNMDLNEKLFEPIGSYRYDKVFKGTFDGQNYTIKNLSQNTWELDNGYYYNDCGLGLFGAIEGTEDSKAIIKNLNIDHASISGESAICGAVAAVAGDNTVFENITVTNSNVADYQYYAGGIVGWASGEQQYINCDVDASTAIAAQWGDFDNSVGGVIGGAGGNATILLKDCDVACRIDAYNDVTSSYQWYAYRRCGMLIGNTGKTTTVDGTTYAAAPQLTCENVTVTYDDWANYTYCEFAGTSWPYVRVQEGVSNSAYSNPRYGHPTDANGNEVVDDTHVHNAGEDHFIECTFDQLYGGGQGVYGTASHDGVKVIYNNK